MSRGGGIRATAKFRLQRMLSAMSQQQFAAKAGVSRQTIQGLEAGVRTASPEVAAKLASALGFSLRQAVLHGFFTIDGMREGDEK